MRFLATLILVLALLAGAAAGAAWWWLGQPIALKPGVASEPPPEFTIEPGHSARTAAQRIEAAGADVPALLLHAWFRASGQAHSIHAGTYALSPGLTPRTLLDRMVRGEQALRSITLVEGWTFRDVMAALQASPDLAQDLQGLTPPQIMERLGQPGGTPKGVFSPTPTAWPATRPPRPCCARPPRPWSVALSRPGPSAARRVPSSRPRRS